MSKLKLLFIALALFTAVSANAVCGDGIVSGSETCDPSASPEGCGTNEICCPVCCQCHSIESVLNYKIPSLPFGMFSNERVNVQIDDSLEYHLLIQNKQVTEIGRGAIDNPTALVTLSSDTLEQLHNQQLQPMDAIRNRLVKYKGVGFVNSLKSRIAGFFLRFLK